MSSSMPGMRYAWIVFQCLPSLYGGKIGPFVLCFHAYSIA